MKNIAVPWEFLYGSSNKYFINANESSQQLSTSLSSLCRQDFGKGEEQEGSCHAANWEGGREHRSFTLTVEILFIASFHQKERFWNSLLKSGSYFTPWSVCVCWVRKLKQLTVWLRSRRVGRREAAWSLQKLKFVEWERTRNELTSICFSLQAFMPIHLVIHHLINGIMWDSCLLGVFVPCSSFSDLY